MARPTGQTGRKRNTAGKAQRAAAKTRTRKNPLDRRHDLVEATIDVLAARGYGGMTLAEVAKAANVSTALIIVHFRSKERLLNEVLKAMGHEYFGALHASQVGVGERPADLLWSLVRAEFSESFFTPRYLAAWKTFWAETNGRKAYVDLFGAQTKHFLDLTIELCRRIIAEGDYDDHDPYEIARLIDTSLGGLWLDLTGTATPVSIDEARRIAASQLALFFPRHFSRSGPR
ncbi:TetR family transcriptional regulator [Dongia rigui]|uniref:TetR family transcriptional regulator n=1 Tax=Dongia rigui TaxID=940149 RepID=A0ABU5DUA4_9PROT|nr:TetR family transcriptional regulator [Dongia rigui]MDY0870894.1 TetR family transcriptional regulator [Dongia rigui]